MRYSSAVAFRQALDQRLKTEAEQTGLALARLRKRVAFELFLRRLVAVAPDRWILKGALALDFRLGVATRATKDIDLGRDDSEAAAIEDINAAQQLALDDFFTFAALRTDDLAGNDEFSAIRFHVTAQLAGRTFDKFVLDIGFGDPLVGNPDTIATSDLLTFAGIAPVHVPAVPLAQHLAEKIDAYTRTYGEAQQPSTRPKDLIDILLIAGVEPLAATELRKALERTFTGRARHAPRRASHHRPQRGRPHTCVSLLRSALMKISRLRSLAPARSLIPFSTGAPPVTGIQNATAGRRRPRGTAVVAILSQFCVISYELRAPKSPKTLGFSPSLTPRSAFDSRIPLYFWPARGCKMVAILRETWPLRAQIGARSSTTNGRISVAKHPREITLVRVSRGRRAHRTFRFAAAARRRDERFERVGRPSDPRAILLRVSRTA